MYSSLHKRSNHKMNGSNSSNDNIEKVDKTPFLIGVGGGTASGKSTVCKRIMEQLGQTEVDHSQRKVYQKKNSSLFFQKLQILKRF